MATDTLKPTAPPAHQGRRRPFSTWMKKLTNFKDTNKKNGNSKKKGANASPYLNNNLLAAERNPNQHSMSTIPTRRTASLTSTQNLQHDNAASFRSSLDGCNGQRRNGERSVAPTIATDHNTAKSTAGHSGNTAATGVGQSTTHAADSTFSSPAPSLRSLTTTLTTVHSTSAAAALNNANGTLTGHNTAHNSMNGSALHGATGSVHFSHQFPISPAPPSAIPGHLAPQGAGGHPATYTTATANNLLTDNASILTLASSSKRRRRRSMDTDASVRALAPSSLFGGSRESLPLSVLSSNVDIGPAALRERASIYSATGVAPALTSERNSFYGAAPSGANRGDGSVRSGVFGHSERERPMHTREGSISGSFIGVGSPLGQAAVGKEETVREEEKGKGKGREV